MLNYKKMGWQLTLHFYLRPPFRPLVSSVDLTKLHQISETHRAIHAEQVSFRYDISLPFETGRKCVEILDLFYTREINFRGWGGSDILVNFSSLV